MRLELELERKRYEAGETLRGKAFVIRGGRARRLEALLSYCDSGPHYSSVALTLPAVSLHRGPLAAGEFFPFAIPIPPDAPPSIALPEVDGRLYWELDLHCARLTADLHLTRAIEVGTRAYAPT
ncbi:MAG: hypothetical protein M3340_18995 [Actinomycetota bacterium]|nr:hypothetical protein [Actinomycetota bacterium]